jgi:hypothetical protein
MFIQINISHSDHPIEEFMALEEDFVKARKASAQSGGPSAAWALTTLPCGC